ncbi:LysE family translocator [Propioniciclava sp.]|uniref:LysE family translocator n=1 Tax=Propioniciclava sp. TaxID=2038686 RepID=UPI002612F16A|nr:LysE family translocator [Propioniciclava sp.]
MPLDSYAAFCGVALLVVLIPGPDFAVVTRSTLLGGRRRGWAAAAGVAVSCALQGVAAVAGLGAMIVASQPVFTAIKWAGVAYLAWLAVKSLRSAWRGEYADVAGGTAGAGFREGFLSNIVNPKVLVFYLALLPQFLPAASGLGGQALLALTHAFLGLLYLVALASALGSLGAWLRRRPVRRVLDVLTGTALGVFSVRLAVDH